MSRPSKVHLDTDVGGDFDDANAIAFLMASEAIDLVAVTTVGAWGNALERAQVAAHVLEAGGHGHVPVSAGLDQPLRRNPIRDGLRDDWVINAYDATMRSAQVTDMHAVDHLLESAATFGDELTLLCIGCLTNVATAIERDPETMRHVGRIVMMGGAFVEQKREANIAIDPEAADIVLRSGIPIRAVGVEVARQIQVPVSVHATSTIRRTLLGQRLARLAERYARAYETDTITLYDVTAAAAISDPELFTFETARVGVELAGAHTRGMTVIEDDPYFNGVAGATTIEIARSCDIEAVSDRFVGRVLEGTWPRTITPAAGRSAELDAEAPSAAADRGSPDGSGHRPPTLLRNLRTDGQRAPRYIDHHAPEFRWELLGGAASAADAQFQVQVAASAEELAGGTTTWDSGWLDGGGANGTRYGGPSLEPLQRYHWQVRCRDGQGAVTAWSPPATFETALLADGGWDAPWLGRRSRQVDDEGRGSVAYLRGQVQLPEPPVRAVVCMSALGIYRLHVNGARVGDTELDPGWTDYDQRLYYQTYDLTGMLAVGANTLEVTLADGWWAGHVAWFGRDLYGSQTAATLQLHLTYADGRRERIEADPTTWQARTGRVLASDLLMGEVQDLRGYTPGGGMEGDDPGEPWEPVVEVPAPAARVEAQALEQIRTIDVLPARSCSRIGDDVTLIDLGQHLTGRLRVRINGSAGQRVVVRHGDALDPDGRLYTANLRSATQENVFVLSGARDEIVEPEFSIQGFRYAEILGDVAPLQPDDVVACVLHNDLPVIGAFATSDPMINQLHHNVLWSQKGNFVSVPTDCPQRDERLGWTGDIHLFADTATYNLDPSRFLASWLRSVEDAQTDDGCVPDIAPFVRLEPRPDGIQLGQPGWGDAIIGVPLALYLHHGDEAILQRHWDAMQRWMEYRGRGGLIQEAGVYADWNFLGPKTPSEVIGTYWYAKAARDLHRVAGFLGRDDIAAELDELHGAIRDAFVKEFFNSDGVLHVETQTAYALAIDGMLLPTGQEHIAASRLVGDLRDRTWTVTTGFVGTASLLPALTRSGFVDVAYRVVQSTAFPSWGYQILNGATTMWEHWDTWIPGQSFQDPKMNSFNHFALATVGSWLYRTVAGINPDPLDGAGYRRVAFTPHPGGGLQYVTAHHHAPVGPIGVNWRREGDELHLTFELPAHATGHLTVPWLTEREHLLAYRGSVDSIAGDGGGVPLSLELLPGTSVVTVPTDIAVGLDGGVPT